MTDRYRFDPSQSEFTVQAFATGLLSFAGHSPSFAARDIRGAVSGEDVEVTVAADALVLVGNFSASDRKEIETRMRRDVLQVDEFAEASFRGKLAPLATIAPGRSRVRVSGDLSLHGVTRPLSVDAEMQVLEDAMRLLGRWPLRLSDHRISPVSALAGTIRLKDELQMSIDLIGLREGS